MPKDMKGAPDEILKITCYNCNSSHSKTSACSCPSNISCSEVCGCNKNGCDNKLNRVISDYDEHYFDDHESDFIDLDS